MRFSESTLPFESSAERYDAFQLHAISEIKDSLIGNPATLAFLAELGELQYDDAIIHAPSDTFFLVQIPILKPGNEEVLNLLEICKVGSNTYNRVHQKQVMEILRASANFQNQQAYFDDVLSKFQDAQTAVDRFQTLRIRFNDGTYSDYNLSNGEFLGNFNANGTPAFCNTPGCYFGLASGIQSITITSQPNTLLPFNVVSNLPSGSSSTPNSWANFISAYNSNYTFNLNGTYITYNSVTGQISFANPPPVIQIDPGLSNGNPIGAQGVPINVLIRAQQSLMATYGIRFDINFLVQFFGLECINQIGTTATLDHLYLESDCIESVLSESELVRNFFLTQYESLTGLNLTEQELQSLLGEDCPTIFGYNTFSQCMTERISNTIAQNFVNCSSQNLDQQIISDLLASYIGTNSGATFAQLNSLCSSTSNMDEKQIATAFHIASVVGCNFDGLVFLLQNPQYSAFAANSLQNEQNPAFAQQVISTFLTSIQNPNAYPINFGTLPVNPTALQLALHQFYINTGFDPSLYPEVVDCFEDSGSSFADKQACALDVIDDIMEGSSSVLQTGPPPNALSLNNPACSRMFNFTNNPPSVFFTAGISNLPITFNLSTGPTSIMIRNLYFRSESLNNCPWQVSDVAAQAINNAIASTTSLLNSTPSAGNNINNLFKIELSRAFRSLVGLCAPANGSLSNDVRFCDDGRAQDYNSFGTQFTDYNTFGSCP